MVDRESDSVEGDVQVVQEHQGDQNQQQDYNLQKNEVQTGNAKSMEGDREAKGFLVEESDSPRLLQQRDSESIGTEVTTIDTDPPYPPLQSSSARTDEEELDLKHSDYKTILHDHEEEKFNNIYEKQIQEGKTIIDSDYVHQVILQANNKNNFQLNHNEVQIQSTAPVHAFTPRQMILNNIHNNNTINDINNSNNSSSNDPSPRLCEEATFLPTIAEVANNINNKCSGKFNKKQKKNRKNLSSIIYSECGEVVIPINDNDVDNNTENSINFQRQNQENNFYYSNSDHIIYPITTQDDSNNNNNNTTSYQLVNQDSGGVQTTLSSKSTVQNSANNENLNLNSKYSNNIEANNENLNLNYKFSNNIEDIPQHFICPITKDIMSQPVVLVSTGQIYEKKAISEWFQNGHRTCPVTGQVVASLMLQDLHPLRSAIYEWAEKAGVEIQKSDLNGSFEEFEEQDIHAQITAADLLNAYLTMRVREREQAQQGDRQQVDPVARRNAPNRAPNGPRVNRANLRIARETMEREEENQRLQQSQNGNYFGRRKLLTWIMGIMFLILYLSVFGYLIYATATYMPALAVFLSILCVMLLMCPPQITRPWFLRQQQ